MTTPVTTHTGAAPEERLERAATALAADGFVVEVLDDVAAARARVAELVPAGARVLTPASETLRLSGIDEDLNASGRYRHLLPWTRWPQRRRVVSCSRRDSFSGLRTA